MDKTKMSNEFLMNFMLKNGFYLSPTEFKSIYKGFRWSDGEFCYNIHTFNHSIIFDDNVIFKAHVLAEKHDKEKSYFKDVYFLAEKQALKKQKMNLNESFNLADSVKTLLSEVIPLVEFSKMDKTFVMDFVVAKGILTKEEADRLYFTHLSVKNDSKVITGDFKDDIGIGRTIGLKSRYYITQSSDKIIRFLDLKFRMPKTPSIVKKTDGIEWYLCLEADEILTFKHHTIVNSSDYLLAEMKSETDFSLTPNETTTIQANFNSFNDILE